MYLKALLRGMFDGPPADWDFRTYTALSTTFAGQAGNTGLSGDLVVGSLAGGGAFLVSVPEPGTGLLLVSMAELAMIQRRRG